MSTQRVLAGTLEALELRARADFALGVYALGPQAAEWLLVHDAVHDRFARYRLPLLDRRPYEFAGLGRGGRQALIVASVGSGATRRLGLLTLATGATRCFDGDPRTYGAGVLADLSSDGRSVAVHSVVYDPRDPKGETEDLSGVAVGIIDTVSGRYRRLWFSRTLAGWGDGSGVAFSPDGRHVAVTYEDFGSSSDGEFRTTVLDQSGHVDDALPLGTALTPLSRTAWLADDQLLLTDIDGAGVRLDLTTGARRPFDADRVVGRCGDRFVVDGGRSAGQPVRLVTRALTGGPTRPWVTLPGVLTVQAVDCA